jgi:hypothetical protein
MMGKRKTPANARNLTLVTQLQWSRFPRLYTVKKFITLFTVFAMET